jgi:pimeloyl-ACP methyl ester carboxylesterase
MFHYEGTETLRKLLKERGISHALFYKDPNIEYLEDFLTQFKNVINQNQITNELILIGHSLGGTYARYLLKNIPTRIKKIITLDSSYLPEYIPHILQENNIKIPYDPHCGYPIHYHYDGPYIGEKNLLKHTFHQNDPFIDTTEDISIYEISYNIGIITNKEDAFFYKEDPDILDEHIQKEPYTPQIDYPSFPPMSSPIKNEFIYYIYTPKYSHSLHMKRHIAEQILNISLQG